MKTITYTQLRSDLSSTLELLRSGESVTVVQRGKPNVVISGITEAVEHDSPKPALQDLPKDVLFTGSFIDNISPEALEGIAKLTQQIDILRNSSETQRKLAQLAMLVSQHTQALISSPDVKAAIEAMESARRGALSFQKALERTQARHADIIKRLEDK